MSSPPQKRVVQSPSELHFEVVNRDLDQSQKDAAGKLMHALVCKRDQRVNQLPKFFEGKLLSKDRDGYIQGIVKEVYGVLTPTIVNTRQAISVGEACGRLKTAKSNKINVIVLVNTDKYLNSFLFNSYDQRKTVCWRSYNYKDRRSKTFTFLRGL